MSNGEEPTVAAAADDGAFFTPDGAGFLASPHTAGPWDPTRFMHFGPPAALMGNAMAATLDTDIPMRIVRATFEVLRPVPIGWVKVTTAVDRPGRKVSMVSSVLVDRDGTQLAVARGWLVRETTLELPVPTGEQPPPPGPDVAATGDFFDLPVPVHYGNSFDMSTASGAPFSGGPATVWMRARVALIAGQELTGLDRVLLVADSGNGISARLPLDGWNYVNTDLSCHLHRHPVGEWIAIDADTTLHHSGIGQARSMISDTTGSIGTSLQSLFVDQR